MTYAGVLMTNILMVYVSIYLIVAFLWWDLTWIRLVVLDRHAGFFERLILLIVLVIIGAVVSILTRGALTP